MAAFREYQFHWGSHYFHFYSVFSLCSYFYSQTLHHSNKVILFRATVLGQADSMERQAHATESSPQKLLSLRTLRSLALTLTLTLKVIKRYEYVKDIWNKLQSAEMYIEMGKFGIPAKHHEAIALIYAKVSTAVSTFESFFCNKYYFSYSWSISWSHVLDLNGDI